MKIITFLKQEPSIKLSDQKWQDFLSKYISEEKWNNIMTREKLTEKWNNFQPKDYPSNFWDDVGNMMLEYADNLNPEKILTIRVKGVKPR